MNLSSAGSLHHTRSPSRTWPTPPNGRSSAFSRAETFPPPPDRPRPVLPRHAQPPHLLPDAAQVLLLPFRLDPDRPQRDLASLHPDIEIDGVGKPVGDLLRQRPLGLRGLLRQHSLPPYSKVTLLSERPQHLKDPLMGPSRTGLRTHLPTRRPHFRP